MYVYMTDKFQDTYQAMFSALNGNFQLHIVVISNSKPLDLFGARNLNWHPDMKMMSDWEKAERNAWELTFDVTLLGCLFHFGRTF